LSGGWKRQKKNGDGQDAFHGSSGRRGILAEIGMKNRGVLEVGIVRTWGSPSRLRIFDSAAPPHVL
jgi:hypothetical protein